MQVVVLNPKTGEVIAMVSAPSYDSNTFTTYISKTQKTKQENIKQEYIKYIKWPGAEEYKDESIKYKMVIWYFLKSKMPNYKI